MIKRNFDKQETCPLCGCNNLSYGVLELYDSFVSYPVTCNECGCSFEENYDLVFSGQNCIETKDGEEVV